MDFADAGRRTSERGPRIQVEEATLRFGPRHKAPVAHDLVWSWKYKADASKIEYFLLSQGSILALC